MDFQVGFDGNDKGYIKWRVILADENNDADDDYLTKILEVLKSFGMVMEKLDKD